MLTPQAERDGLATAERAEPPSVADMYRCLWPGLVRLGHLLTGSPALGEDLAQEAFVGLLTATRSRSVAQPEAYLRRSLANLVINAGKRAQREREYAVRYPEAATAAPVEDDSLWPLVKALPPRQRAVLVLRYYCDMTEAEIASTLSCRPGTVKAHASKALTRLHKELEV